MKFDTSQIFPTFGNFLFNNRKSVLVVIFLITTMFAWNIPAVRMLSDFADLLPQEHPYIQLHNSIRDTFGGANIIVMAMEVEEGTIFTDDSLDRIHRITQKLDSVSNINHNLVSSLTHRNTRKIYLTPDGTIRSQTYYDPHHDEYTEEQLAKIQRDVVASTNVYGLLVSPDMKSALIKGTLNEGQLDYGKVFDEIQAIRASEIAPGVKIHATGHPVLVGWVDSYSGDILLIFFYTILIVLAILIFYSRRLYGILLPLVGMILTSIWGVGFMGVFGYNLDPLMLVVPFLISARSMSHGIQKLERYFLELSRTHERVSAARNTFNALFRPGALAIVADASALYLIGLGSVPINDKMAIYASFWAVCMVVTVLIVIPMLLAELPRPKEVAVKHTMARVIFPKFARVVGTPGRSRAVLITCLVITICATYFGSWVQIGEPEPGSPLLYRDHDFNISSTAINDRFPGAEELFIIARADENGGLKKSEIMKALADFQNHMMLDPKLGGVKGVNNLLTQVNQMTRNNDPRWAVIPSIDQNIGGLLFMFMMSAPTQGALQEYIDTDDRLANMVFYYKDHTGETIRRAIYMAKEWIDTKGAQIEGLHIDLAGGPVGVTAAINEEAFDTNVIVVPAVLLLILCFTLWFYGSFHAGFMMLVSMTFATTLTYACMGLLNMGLNVNTVPMIAVGIGLGVDYAIYMMDRIKEEMHVAVDVQDAIRRAVTTTGVAIALTATTLVGGIIMWVFISELRFQADAARLLIIMLIMNMAAAMFLVPAWVNIFKPKFIMQAAEERWAKGEGSTIDEIEVLEQQD